MNICLIHGQSYPLGSYCPYCGEPTHSVSTGNTEQVVWPIHLEWAECPACKYPGSSAAHTCNRASNTVSTG